MEQIYILIISFLAIGLGWVNYKIENRILTYAVITSVDALFMMIYLYAYFMDGVGVSFLMMGLGGFIIFLDYFLSFNTRKICGIEKAPIGMKLTYAYILIWLNYFFGRKEVYKNTKIQCRITRFAFRPGYLQDWYLSDYKNKEIKFNRDFKKKTSNLTYDCRLTRTLSVKVCPVSKKLLVFKAK